MVLLTDCHSFEVLRVSRSAVILPSGAMVAFGVITHVPTFVHKLKSSLSVNRFVLAHSTSNHLSVVFGIATQFASVSKYFTQSTFAPWNGEESTFVDTYSAAVWID